MSDDYRNTLYCPGLETLIADKNTVSESIKEKHPRAIDMHAYISKNDGSYKIPFSKAYNFKCSYCGVSFSILPKEMFEIDHFIYEKSPEFSSKAEAGFIENLVLSCYSCNRKKSSFTFTEVNRNNLHPDKNEIRKVFIRDDSYYIFIAEEYKEDSNISDFYDQIKLGSELNRLEYLLLNMMGLHAKLAPESGIKSDLGESIESLRLKRNKI